MKPVTLGLIIGNRGFFPSHLCESGRKSILDVLEKAGFKVITLGVDETEFGSIESLEDARKCGALFKKHAEEIDGVLVTLPNFGDEKAVANALRWSGLRVPVLVHAFADDAANMMITDRRDSFCGKMSVCNNLTQYEIPFSLTSLHTCDPTSASFAGDLARFDAICRVVRSVRNLRIGALGARPQAFNTVRYSEKLLENHGISVETLDLFEFFGWVEKEKDDSAIVLKKLEEIKNYVDTSTVDAAALLKMAKFGAILDQWMKDADLQCTAVQCWTAMEEFFGVVPCTIMSMLSNGLLPSACEVDVMGTLAMHILAQASNKISALVDWNNNYGDDPDKGVVFHCSNLPKDIFRESGEGSPVMDYQEILAGSVGKENSYGTIVGRIAAAPFTYLRVGTDDTLGSMRAYVGEGKFTDDTLLSFGGYGVVEVPRFQELLKFICENGFEHHVTVNPSLTGAAVAEALDRYLGWDLYHHE